MRHQGEVCGHAAEFSRIFIARRTFGGGADVAMRISEVRGTGLMIGIQPITATGEIVKRGLDRGLLINIAGADTIRVLPPLVMTLEQAGELGAGIAHILNDVASQEDNA